MHEHLPARRLTGGLRLPAGKEASTAGPIRRGLVPTRVVLSLRQGRGPAAVPVVRVGDRVLRGQRIAAGEPPFGTDVHASTSGHVTAIALQTVPAFGAVERTMCVTIQADGRHAAAGPAGDAWPDAPERQLDAIARAGIVGLGGAAYPTAAKLAGGPCRKLIVNGAECEPYISCDDLLMREQARDIVAGTALVARIAGAELSIVAIERDKPAAIQAMHAALAEAGDDRIRIAEVPTIYPAGGERQLIDVIAGIEVPSGRFPGDIGYVCQNVGTVFAVARLALAGTPLTSRIVTVTGQAVAMPANVEVPIGTPIGELLDFCGGCREPPAMLIHGGSMMGYALPSAELPVTKSTNCVIAALPGELKAPLQEWPCIRCGECAFACPARLLPQDLLTAARGSDVDMLAAEGLADCIECGCCDIVCPSHIPLTATFVRAKQALARAGEQARLSDESVARHRRRELREQMAAAEEQDRQEQLQRQVDDPQARQAAIAAAVERARRRRSPDTDDDR